MRNALFEKYPRGVEEKSSIEYTSIPLSKE